MWTLQVLVTITPAGSFDGRESMKHLAQMPKGCARQYNLACSYSLTDQCELAAKEWIALLLLGIAISNGCLRIPISKISAAHPVFRKLRARIRTCRFVSAEALVPSPLTWSLLKFGEVPPSIPSCW